MYFSFTLAQDADHPNAFYVRNVSGKDVTLRDIYANFPLPGNYKFRFKVEAPHHISQACGIDTLWADISAKDSVVPVYEGNLVMRACRCRSSRARNFASESKRRGGTGKVAAMTKQTKTAVRRRQKTTTKHRVDAGNERSSSTTKVAFGTLLGSGAAKFLRRASDSIRKGGRDVIAAFSQMTGKSVDIGHYSVDVHKKVADGGFSQVFLCESREDGRRMALKCMNVDESDDFFHLVRREIQTHTELTKLGHSNIAPLLASSKTRSSRQPGMWDVRLLMPYYERRTLFHTLIAAENAWRKTPKSCRWPFSERTALRMFVLVCKGVAAMHERGFAHRDLKPANVMLSNDTPVVPLLTDFGSVVRTDIVNVRTRKQASQMMEEAAVCASAAYRAPELWDIESPASIDPAKCDVWSLGCVLYALAFGRSPFEPTATGVNAGSSVKLAICSAEPHFPPGNRNIAGVTFSDEFCDFIRNRMLQPRAELRPTVAGILREASSLKRSSSR